MFKIIHIQWSLQEIMRKRFLSMNLTFPLSQQCLRLLNHTFNRDYSHVCVSASESKVKMLLKIFYTILHFFLLSAIIWYSKMILRVQTAENIQYCLKNVQVSENVKQAFYYCCRNLQKCLCEGVCLCSVFNDWFLCCDVL